MDSRRGPKSRLLMLCLVASASLLLLLFPDACNAKIHGHDMQIDQSDIQDETVRVRLFQERHGTWPDPKWLETEKPGYTARMEEKAREAMAIRNREDRWNAWQGLSQARMVPRVTENQWEVVDAPKHIHQRLYENFHKLLPDAGFELDPQGAIKGGTGVPKFLPQEELNYEILEEMTPLFEEWCGMKLEPTAVYGVRLYQEGQILKDHLDVIETHVISGILHIDSDVDEPYLIQIDNADGTEASENLKPGQLMFYESAKSFHQRKFPMKGRYYGSIFMHYRPVGWNITRRDVKIAVPPYWADGLDEIEAQQRQQEQNQEENELLVYFENHREDPMVLHWVIPGSEKTSADGQPQMQRLKSLEPGEKASFHTGVGHTFFGTFPDSSFMKWDMEPGHSGVTFHAHESHAEL